MCIDNKKRRSCHSFARKLHILDHTQQRRGGSQRAWRGRNNRRLQRGFEDGATDQIIDEKPAGGKRNALFDREQHLESAKLLCLRNGIAPFEMKNGLALMVLAEPAGFHCRQARLEGSGATTRAKKSFRQSCQAFVEIREEFSSHFAFIAAGTENP